MPEKEYIIRLDPQRILPDLMRVYIRTRRGRVVDFVAQYEAFIAGVRYPIVRFDGSHGAGHRDLLDKQQQTIRKDWFPDHISLAESLNAGIRDIVDHWGSYRSQFIAREGVAEK